MSYKLGKEIVENNSFGFEITLTFKYYGKDEKISQKIENLKEEELRKFINFFNNLPPYKNQVEQDYYINIFSHKLEKHFSYPKDEVGEYLEFIDMKYYYIDKKGHKFEVELKDEEK